MRIANKLYGNPALVFYVFSISFPGPCLSTDRLNKSSIQVLYRITPKIVGGKPVDIKKYPSAAILLNYGSLCGATILNSWSVLTAAHCFDLNNDIEEMSIQTGGRYIFDAKADVYSVASLIMHPEYSLKKPFACDIAVMFSTTQIQLGKRVKKAIIADSSKWMNPKESKFQVVGWGLTKYGGSISDVGLLMVSLRYFSADQCGKNHQVTLTEDMFCLYGNGEKDACKGDSGGGVYWKNQLVGIVSHGDRCAVKDKPSVYANVFYFRNWIRSVVTKYMHRNCFLQP